MPNGKVHAVFGLFMCYTFPHHLAVLSTIAGSLAPDADIKYAPAGKVFPLWTLPGVYHRGITHTIWFAIGLSLLIGYLFKQQAGWSFFAGYMSHLLLDACTPMGIDLIKGKRPRKKPRKRK